MSIGTSYQNSFVNKFSEIKKNGETSLKELAGLVKDDKASGKQVGNAGTPDLLTKGFDKNTTGTASPEFSLFAEEAAPVSSKTATKAETTDLQAKLRGSNAAILEAFLKDPRSATMVEKITS